ncbi:MAG: hypothetical protein HC887_05445 [Desulfobacteraceae bacterium]|nr:hypothetical protein [Desulfobacteraceae bacterium]
MKLQLHNAGIGSRNSLFSDMPGNTDETGEAFAILGQLDRKIAEVRAELDDPEDYLNKVADLLCHPEQFLKAEPVRMIVNDMNIVVDRDSQKRGDEIRFTEISTGTGDRKAAVLAVCERF